MNVRLASLLGVAMVKVAHAAVSYRNVAAGRCTSRRML
jgi:DNA-binding transcriptional regulator YdaS (Cro superfamily)